MVVNRSSFLLLSLLSLVSQVQAVAQDTGGISGTVADEDDRAIVGATVSVTNPDLNIVNMGGLTDARGDFRIAALPPGKGYYLTVSFPSMGKIIQSDIEIQANKMVVVPITLRPSEDLAVIACPGFRRVPAMDQLASGIRGAVFDDGGQPVTGASVFVRNPGLGVFTAGLTDARGEFRIEPLPVGKGYSLNILSPWRVPLDVPDIEVPAQKVILVPITLQSSSH